MQYSRALVQAAVLGALTLALTALPTSSPTRSILALAGAAGLYPRAAVAEGARFTEAAYRSATLAAVWGRTGDGPGEFRWPFDVAVAPDGSVFVLDYGFKERLGQTNTPRVQRFDRDGRFLSEWGHGQLDRPFALTIGPDGDVWVADTFHHAVKHFAPDGTLRASWGSLGTEAGEFDRPTDLHFDRAGNLHVVEFGNNRVQVFAPNGRSFRTWGGAGIGPGQLCGPHGIAVDAAGAVYVGDTNNHRIVKYGPTGSLLEQWESQPVGTPSCPRAAGDIDCPPFANGQLCRPRHLALDPAGNVLVADRNHHRIQIFGSRGRPLGTVSGDGTTPGQLRFPYGVAVTAGGELFVADTDNDRLQRFDLGAPFRADLPLVRR
ncbi:MAG: NHL repeat-containing protein [Chloroflexi bacterium]|nr:NHL repeat-containing protein [Chloroflexota bacterium]